MDKNKIHILVVDDDDRIRDLIKQYLNDNNFMVSSAIDSADAKVKLAQFRFDLIILDVMTSHQSRRPTLKNILTI